MSFLLRNTRKEHLARPIWANSAFIVEAIVLLVFLVASAAVFMQLFSMAALRSDEGGKTAAAIAAASSTAERFAADPAHAQAVTRYDDLLVVCETDATRHVNGTLYRADITVYTSDGVGESADADMRALAGQEAVYAISTSAYVSEVSG